VGDKRGGTLILKDTSREEVRLGCIIVCHSRWLQIGLSGEILRKPLCTVAGEKYLK
jgi:hypothetical protein